jgi:hypothetical protein
MKLTGGDVSDTLVDSHVILDVLTEDDKWLDWSSSQLAESTPACS